MKPGPLIKDLLAFNRMELRGVVVLLTLYFALLAGTFFVPALIPETPADFKGFEKEVNDFMKALARLDSEEALSKEKKYGRYRNLAAGALPDTAKFPSYKKEKILVELNSADTFDLQRLQGIGPSFAKRIVKYRERLGGFRNKKQVLEVWGMDTARYNRISENLSVNADSVHRIDLN
jgi:competence ComEA-like helix-hairpin-helix protein